MKVSRAVIKKFLCKKRVIILLSIITFVSLSYFFYFQHVDITPKAEKEAMIQLETIKHQYEIQAFKTDGCSGNVSKSWDVAVSKLSDLFPGFSEKYRDAQNIPFEAACVVHDQTYHLGEGGYVARLEADNKLRRDIIEYGISNTKTIIARTNLKSDEEAIFLYEAIAETVYLSVRVGGKPCNKMPYAWGFGYNNGRCERLDEVTN